MAPAIVAVIVIVIDMRQLVRNHAGELIAREHLQKPGCNCHSCVVWISTRRERIWLTIIH